MDSINLMAKNMCDADVGSAKASKTRLSSSRKIQRRFQTTFRLYRQADNVQPALVPPAIVIQLCRGI
jgi:hypothetical protein